MHARLPVPRGARRVRRACLDRLEGELN